MAGKGLLRQTQFATWPQQRGELAPTPPPGHHPAPRTGLSLQSRMQALYHVVSEWIIEQAGFGLVDRVVKLCFDIAFGAITFFWVVRTVWRVHGDAYAHRKKRTQQMAGVQKQP